MATYNEIFPIEYGKRYQVSLPKMVSDSGKEHIRDSIVRWMYDHNDGRMSGSEILRIVNSVMTPEIFNDTEGGPRFTKRVGIAFAKHERAIKISTQMLTSLGNQLNNYTVPARTFELVFQNHVNGGPKDYCHGRSCWWTEYPASRDWLVYNGGGGLLAYQIGGTNPIGRIWHAPSPNGNMLLFNAYGEIGLPITWAEAVSSIFEGTKASVITWNEQAGGEVYFNQRTNTGYVNAVGKPTSSINSFWRRPDRFVYPRYLGCNQCGERYEERELEDGICPTCAANFCRCPECGNRRHRDEFVEARGREICRRCFEYRYSNCRRCGTVVGRYENYCNECNQALAAERGLRMQSERTASWFGGQLHYDHTNEDEYLRRRLAELLERLSTPSNVGPPQPAVEMEDTGGEDEDDFDSYDGDDDDDEF